MKKEKQITMSLETAKAIHKSIKENKNNIDALPEMHAIQMITSTQPEFPEMNDGPGCLIAVIILAAVVISTTIISIFI